MSDNNLHQSSINLRYQGVNNLVGVSGWNTNNDIVGFTCLVMPMNELRLSTEDGENIILPLAILY